jgi:Mg2+-importing ATPase
MFIFGIIGSISDSLLIIPLRYFFLISKEQLQTILFLFSVLSENLVILIIRTKKLFYKSVPSSFLLLTICLTTIVTLILPFTDLGKNYLGFVKIPNTFMIYSIFVLFSYLIVTEIAKLIFFKKMKRSKI